MRRFFLSAVILLVPPACWAAPEVKLPAEVKGDPGAFVRIPATTSQTVVKWFVLDPGLALFPTDLLKDTRTAVVIATRPGRYRLICWTAEGGLPSDAAETVVIVGEAPPPGPTPPVPPGPTPPPNDPFVLRLQAIFASDLSPTRTADKAALSALYKQGIDLAKDPALPTAEALRKVMADATTKLIGQRLVPVRQAIWAEVLTILPTETTALTEPKRAEVAAMFLRIHQALEQVK